MDACTDPIPSAEEMQHEIEHGDYHMDGELCGMGEGDKSDKPLAPGEAMRLAGEYDG